jgi:AraC family transcriptional regulator, transcriptional activator of the genes for pyochelin and ferripyochelin receptors
MKLSARDLRTPEELFKQASRATDTAYHSDGYELALDFPHTIGRGYVRNVRLREGLEVFIADCELREGLVVEASAGDPALEINLHLAGETRGYISGIREEFALCSGESSLFFGPAGTHGTVRFPAHRRVVVAEVRLSPAVFESLLTEERELPAGLPGVAFDRPGVERSILSGEERLAAHQLLNCPFDGALGRLYLEAKALELVALRFSRPSGREASGSLDPYEAERVREAAEVLAREMAQPPSLLELSRRVGLNDFKLKAGFKQVFGTTAFGYLHELRMERARHLLEAGEMNVGEVALEVGYTSPSRFAAAFKKRFGIRPSSLLPRRSGSSKHLTPLRDRIGKRAAM